jgi:hypothetical protein
MAATNFGKVMSSSGSNWVPSELLRRQYGRRQVMERTVEPVYRRVIQRTVTVRTFYHAFHDLSPTIWTLK